MEKEFTKRGVSLSISEWPEKGRIRRHWTFQRIGNEEDAPRTQEDVEKIPWKTETKKEALKNNSKGQPKKKTAGRKPPSSDTILVELASDSSSPLSDKSVVSVMNGSKDKPLFSPLARKKKQERIEKEERQEFMKERQKEQRDKAHTKACREPRPKNENSKAAKSVRPFKKCHVKPSDVLTIGPTSRLAAQVAKAEKLKSREASESSKSSGEGQTHLRKCRVRPSEALTSGSSSRLSAQVTNAPKERCCPLEKRVKQLAEIVEDLVWKVDGLQRTMTDSQKIAASKHPRLGQLIDQAESSAIRLHSQYCELIFLDNFPLDKRLSLKKMANDLSLLKR